MSKVVKRSSDDRLPREILKWVQSLDLAYSVKRARRDFANGFLIAEIFSRYDTRKIEMHSFDNGISLKAKKDNWELLQKHFRRRQFKVADDNIEGILYCRSGYLVPFLCKCYTHLTGRKCRLPPPRPEKPPMPPFMKSTAAQAIRDTLQTSAQEIQDYKVLEEKLQETLEIHNSQMDEDRASGAVERQSLVGRPSKVLRGEARAVGKAKKLPKITVKKVNVKNIDHANIAQLRLKQMSAQTSVHQPSKPGGKAASPARGRQPVGLSVMSALVAYDDVVKKTLASMPEAAEILDGVSGSELTVVNFFEALSSPKSSVDDTVAAAVVAAMAEQGPADVAADSCVHEPKHLHEVARLFLKAITALPSDGQTFAAVVRAFEALGAACTAKDGRLARANFCDCVMCLASFQRLLLKSQPKRRALLRIMYAFTSSDPMHHIEMIRSLKDNLDDMDTFIFCLCDLVQLEHNCQDHLLDLYGYYCVIGLGKSYSRLRAGCVSMIGTFGENKRQFAAGLIPRMLALASDPHWEVQAQLAITTAKLLPCYDSPSPEHDQLTGMVITLLRSGPCAFVRQLAVCHLLPVLTIEMGPGPASGNPLRQLFSECMKTLLDMPRHTIKTCLSADKSAFPLGGGQYALPAMVKEWDACVVVDDIARDITEQKYEFIEPKHMEVVAAAVTHCDTFEDDATRWKAAFADTGLMDYIFVAMCDPDCCDLAIQTLHTFVYGPTLLRSLILQSEAFVGALRLLFGPENDSDPLSQQAVIAFFDSGLGGEGQVSQDMKRVLRAARPGLEITPALEKLYNSM